MDLCKITCSSLKNSCEAYGIKTSKLSFDHT